MKPPQDQTTPVRDQNVPHAAHRPQKTGPHRILVSGVGRSGTTLVYKQIARQLSHRFDDVNFRYEPYLWNIRGPVDQSNPFDMSQLHYPGLQAHTQTPLFLDAENEVHDRFVASLYDATSDTDPTGYPDAYLTKVIRGGGRLRAYLRQFPDLKIVVCLRNPVDTINSSLGMFSLFGEEFYADDRHRFRAELEARGVDISALDAPRLCVEWYAAWWRSFTQEALSLAKDYPENVFVFRYEAFLHDPETTLDAVFSFVGVNDQSARGDLRVAAGTVINAKSLTLHDMQTLAPDMDTYFDDVLLPHLGVQATADRRAIVAAQQAGGTFSLPVAGGDLGRKCPIQLRDIILRGGSTPFLSLTSKQTHPVSLPELIANHCRDDRAELLKPVTNAEAIKQGATFGAVITCHNDADTVVGAVLSCLNQTLPFDEIVVVDGNSSGETVIILNALAQRFSSITLVHSADTSPSANRDLGVRTLTTTFCTHLSARDLFWPTKNAEEATTISTSRSSIAFSDRLVANPGSSDIEETTRFSGNDNTAIGLALLSRTPKIPRDMTVARDLYLKAGGCDPEAEAYHDWALALRLAATGETWSRANGLAGTVSNQLKPTTDEIDESTSADIVALIFLRSLNVGLATPTALIEAYDKALNALQPSDLADLGRTALRAAASRGTGALKTLATLATEQSTTALPGETSVLTDSLTRFTAGLANRS